ncbi:putative guanyl-specific ribonuclease F1 [Colletotrichum sublineola]|uniref:ribonuclease T1 n=1 Tax=Colletotrichum sublineola TaxID=1173701 RepID=A0A066XRS2_COLSU|nr:putative guanyl-specific ribonuclease F1 [Colletotrichum sublineola]
MRFSASATLLVLLGTVNGLPANIEARVPSNAPIDLFNRPDSSKSFKCGDKTYTGHEIYLAAQRGTNLYLAGETRGRNQYPHPFPNDDSKGNTLKFPKECPADDSRYEFPLMNGSPYDGGKNNVKQGDERVVYYYEDGETSADGNPQVYYCGIMTHKGAPSGGFLMC